MFVFFLNSSTPQPAGIMPIHRLPVYLLISNLIYIFISLHFSTFCLCCIPYISAWHNNQNSPLRLYKHQPILLCHVWLHGNINEYIFHYELHQCNQSIYYDSLDFAYYSKCASPSQPSWTFFINVRWVGLAILSLLCQLQLNWMHLIFPSFFIGFMSYWKCLVGVTLGSALTNYSWQSSRDHMECQFLKLASQKASTLTTVLSFWPLS